MANLSFTNDERDRAKAEQAVLVGFYVEGGYAPGFPDQTYKHADAFPPELADEAIDFWRALVRRHRESKATTKE